MKFFFQLLFSLGITSLLTYSQVPTIQLVEYATGFTQPSDIESTNDGRLFVSELTGKIKIIQSSLVNPIPFLDISSKGASIYSFCFHPNYAQNGTIFVYYRKQDGYGRISKFTRSVSNPDLINSASEVEILTIPYILPGGHTGGEIVFGPDSFLYITTGDDGLGPRNKRGDPDNNSQNLKKLFGKILRIDVNNSNSYSIPSTNPYLTPNDEIPDEIWARGLRNPWRMSFDSSTGDMWIGDNGADGWEEVNFLSHNHSGGANFGWRCYEGSHLYYSNECPDSTQLVFPIQEYSGYASDTTSGASIMGGYVYRGTKYPSLNGYYVYADWVTGNFWTVRRNDDGSRTNVFQGILTSQPVTFGQDSDKEMYVASFDQGAVYKMSASTENRDVSVKASTKKASCDKKGLIVNQDAQLSLTEFDSGDRYDFNQGINYTGVASFTTGSKLIPPNGIIVQSLPSPASMQTFTIRVFKSSNLHKDINVTLTPTICIPCVIAPPQVVNHSICGIRKDTLIASGCESSTTTTWFLDSLATIKAPGFSIGSVYITSVLANTTPFFVACVRDSLCQSEIVKMTVTVNTNPTPTLSGKIICAGSSDSLKVQNCAGTVTWTDGVSPNPRIVSPTTTTNYTAICTLPTGCKANVNTTVKVLLKPLIPLKMDTTVCIYQKIDIIISGCSSQHPLKVFQDSLLQKEVRIIDNKLTIDSVLTSSRFYSVCEHDSSVFCKVSPSLITIRPRSLPQNLQTTEITESSFKAEWKTTKNVIYKLRFRKTGANDWNYAQLITATTPGVYSHHIGGLLKGTVYEWSVKEADCEGERAYSEIQSARTLLCPPKLILGSEILPATLYQANDIIESTSTLSEGTTQFYAGQAIILKPGFNTSANKTFLVQVKSCD